MKVATAAELGEPVWLDKSIYFGPPQSGCVLGPADKMVCMQRSGKAAPQMNAIIGQSQLRNPLSLERTPPVAIPGITGNDRVSLNHVLAAPGGFVFLYQSDPIDSAYQLSFVTDQGAQLWASTLPTVPRDLAVTADELLIGTPDGVSSLKLSNGTPGATHAKAGTLLAGTTPGRDGFSSYAPGVVGLSTSDGGTVLNAVDVHGSQGSSCEFTGAAGCTPTRVLYADSEYLVVVENAGEGGPTSAYDAKGAKLWTVDQPLTSVVRFQEAFVLGYAGPTKNTSLPAGRMAVVSAGRYRIGIGSGC
ncbi:hypothetical protein [Paenarthrobacter sp. PH39-S1]|uniref:hypothetical protein n=1 Tax=Paenarthrobacter sp. PH39-S1 TaxID=3046204 RepID=UPI0024B914F3|nr:hypothetical protein [Paenarthrobacter sp. PH39-S1]MDJ0356271.1 hypothetical protein [Paenarthrobacter sp. PH39-S1]